MIEDWVMGYKEIGNNFSFADLAVAKSLSHNRNLKMMEKINADNFCLIYSRKGRFPWFLQNSKLSS